MKMSPWRKEIVHRVSSIGSVFSACLLLAMCTAQEPDDTVLPTGLQHESTIEKMKSTFCSGCNQRPPITRPQDGDIPLLCQQLCGPSGSSGMGNPRVCWTFEHSDTNLCEDDQAVVCGYEDAVVCKYKDERGLCVYHDSNDFRPFCICKDEADMWPKEGSISDSCESEADLFIPQPTTRAIQDAATTTTTTTTNKPRGGFGGARGGPNVAATVLGGILAVVFILVVIGLTGWYLRRQGKLCAPRAKPPHPDEAAKVDQNVNAAGAETTHQLPEQLVPDIHEYTYVDSIWQSGATNPETGEPKPASCYQEDHCYQQLEKVENGKRGNLYTQLEPENTAASKDPSGPTQASGDNVYFVLEKEKDGADDSTANEDLDPDYQTPDAAPLSPCGYEVVSPTPGPDDPSSSTYDRLDRSFNKGTMNTTKECDNETDCADYDHISHVEGNINQTFAEESEY